MIQRAAPLLALLAAACTSGGGAPPQPAAPLAPPAKSPLGADRLMGKNARFLVQEFGRPVLDVREDGARKLQFAGGKCTLDAYLYAPQPGKEPVVTYVAARTPDGRGAERNSCIAALEAGD